MSINSILLALATDPTGMQSHLKNIYDRNAWQEKQAFGESSPTTMNLLQGVVNRWNDAQSNRLEYGRTHRPNNFEFVPLTKVLNRDNPYSQAQRESAYDQNLVNQGKAPVNDPGLLRFYLMQKSLDDRFSGGE